MVNRPNTAAQRKQRHARVRGKISGTPERPRLCVFRSESNIYAQVIDDVNGNTLVSASSVEKDFEGNGGNVEAAKKIGSKIAERALAKGIEEVVFDRGGYIYHGRVKALAEAAREGGLKFLAGGGNELWHMVTIAATTAAAGRKAPSISRSSFPSIASARPSRAAAL